MLPGPLLVPLNSAAEATNHVARTVPFREVLPTEFVRRCRLSLVFGKSKSVPDICEGPLSMYVSTVLQSNKDGHLTIMTICFDVNTSGVDLTTRHVTFSNNVSVLLKCSAVHHLLFFPFTRITFNNCKYFRLTSQLPANPFFIAFCHILQSVSYTVAIISFLC
jgi:hypothetical protein